MSKAQAGKIELEHLPLDLVQICEECAALFSVAAEDKGVSLIVCPPPGAHSVDRVTVDRERLLDGARAGYALMNDAFGQRSAPAYFAVVLGE